MSFDSIRSKEKIANIIGKTLHAITEYEGDLILNLGNKEIVFQAVGACCSESWIESVESPTQPEVIVSFEEIEISPTFEPKPSVKKDHTEMDHVRYYFYKLTTDKSSYLIEMRNNSNGYYGGTLE